MTIEETTQTENSAYGKLLTVEERAACELLAEGDSLQSRRAQALLALDQGATQRAAGTQSGLTPGQLKYCLKIFRNGRMTIFPELDPTPPDDLAQQPVELETAVVSLEETETDQAFVQPDKKTIKAEKKKPAMKTKKGTKKKSAKKSKKSTKKSKKSAKKKPVKKPKKKVEKKKSSKKAKKKK